MKTHYGHQIRLLHWCADQRMTTALADMELTAAQGHILAFLSHRTDPACPRDVEDAFQLSHPTVSGLLARLEKKDFIEFQPDPADRRCKRIILRPKGTSCIDKMHRIIRENEEQMVRGFTEQEQTQFASLLKRATENMGVPPCCHSSQEVRKK